MKRKLKYLLTLLWFIYLIVTSVLLFTKGFLLTREVQTENSTCLFSNDISCGSDQQDTCDVDQDIVNRISFDEAHERCFKTNYKVVLLIVDALRYDFTVFDSKNQEPLPYENKLPIIKSLLDEQPNSTRLYKFIADPPTTTMQRLKALTTGSLPTFIDAGSNFATSEISEDNIIDQMIKQNQEIVFMGDDTWTSLYPNRFLRNYPYPSFDVWDLDTVDQGVKARLFPEFNNSDWNMLIGHFLGVDHCGHRYGPNHPEMTRKLSEINHIIEEVIEVMDDKTVLFVVGDHGMTVTGDHGGDSLDEILAAMFVYSKRPLLQVDKQKVSVKQVDLVPTLSALLGVPTPFQNLGILIPDALPKMETVPNSRRLPLFWLWGNVQQVVTYIKTYSRKSDIFDREYLELYYAEYESLREQLASVKSEVQFEEFYRKSAEFLLKVRTLCEEVWIQFDAVSISNGLTFLFLTLFFMFIIADGIPLKHIPSAIEGSFVVVCVIALCFSAIGGAILEFTDILSGFRNSGIFITSVLSQVMFLLPVLQNWGAISFNWYSRNKTHNMINFVCRFVLIFNVCVVFSNSFINEESSVLLFLLVTLILLSVVGVSSYHKTPQRDRKSDSISTSNLIKLVLACLVVLALLRGSVHFWRCRVEQEWCFKSPRHELGTFLKTKSTKFQWGLTVVSLSLLIISVKTWLRKCGNLSGYSLTETCTKLLPSVIIVLIAGFWVFQRLAGNNKSMSRTSNYLALSVYVLSAKSIALLVAQPICVSVVLRNGQRLSISALFNLVKESLKKDDDDSATPIVCGLGTVYSAVYLILGSYLVLVISLVLGDAFALSLVIKCAVGAFFLVATSVLRIRMANSVEDLLNVPSIAVLGWTLLPQYFFYATGHQPAFSNIAWESAFVGTSNLFSHNYILGSLVLLNTFGTYVLSGILLPLLIITPFTLLVIMPSLGGKQKEFHGSFQKGELLLYEKERVTVAALFVLSCKYIAGYTLKVFASMLAATIHCRHLMVWNVFAPKFIFEGLALFITLGSVLIGYLVFLRVNSQVGRFLTKLYKIN